MKIELNSAGVRELLKSPEMQALLKERASEVAGRAGAGYDSDVFVGRNRANASVFATTKKAQRDNLKNNTILKSLR